MSDRALSGDFHIWYSRSGADQGLPFNVLDLADGSVTPVPDFTAHGECTTQFCPGGFSYPDGPRAVLVLKGTITW